MYVIMINLTSGLGNQLFQYFFGESLKRYHNQEVKYIDSLLPPHQIKLWDIFNINFDLIQSNEITKFSFALNKNKFLYVNFLKFLNKFDLNSYFKIYSEKNFDFNNFNPQLNKEYLFYGYWQDFQFSNLFFENIKNSLVFKKKLSLNKLYKNIEDFSDIVGIHIRGGDYLSLNNKKIFIQLNEEFYQSRIKYFIDEFKNPLFLFFTDDIQHLHNLISEKPPQHLIISQINNNPEDDFQYLTLCDHFIIPNSTFSLWASKFAKNSKKIIFKPKNWFNQEYLIKKDISDLSL